MLSYDAFCQMKREATTPDFSVTKYFQNFFPGMDFDFQKREYSSKLLKHSIVKRFLVITVDIGIFLSFKNFSSVLFF